MVWLPPASPPTVPPEEVIVTEPLARSLHSRRHFKKGESDGEPGKVRANAFEPPRDEANSRQRLREVSTDRCHYLTQDKAVQLAGQRAEKRGVGFYGWAIITADEAQKSERDVISSPAKDHDNPAHANILLPIDTVNDDQTRNRHLLELAESSCWLGCPT